MQGCAMQFGDGRVSGICLCGFHGYAPSRGFVVFTPYAGWQGIGFVSSICSLGVHLVSGVFGWLDGDIYLQVCL